MSVTLHTNLGDIKCEIFCDEVPKAAENFLALCASGYYDGTVFHRNIKGFMIQGGDPTGTGKGGTSIWGKKFNDEIRESLKHNARGILSMANSGPNTNGSQFFISYAKQPHLNGLYTVFGKVIHGFEVLDIMEKTQTGPGDRPLAEIRINRDAGVEIDPLGDLNTEAERKLGQLVLQKYGSEFYILHCYPLAVRPYYTKPCQDSPLYSDSFDVFIRGEEIISGSQHVHKPELLIERAHACGIDVKTISTYIDSFRYAVPPHGGFGAGLERVVMLFCGLNNIRQTSLFPRDSHRNAP